MVGVALSESDLPYNVEMTGRENQTKNGFFCLIMSILDVFLNNTLIQ